MSVSLLINTFISETPLSKLENRGKGNSWINNHYEDLIQKKIIYPYKKIDIFKYTLVSYSHQNWSAVEINFDSESKYWNEEILGVAKKYFKNAKISPHRIIKKQSFLEHLYELKSKNVTWVFYSPNHDHPVNSVAHFNIDSLIAIANELRTSNPDAVVSIAYSHHLENTGALNNFSLFHGLNNIFPRILSTAKDYSIVSYPRFSPDSIQILHINDLIELFNKTTINEIRRTECMTDIFTNLWKTHILIIPKREFCRHFDSYFHLDNLFSGGGSTLDYIPPLIIPNGIFDGNIIFDSISDTRVSLKNIYGMSIVLFAGKDVVPYFWRIHSDLNAEQLDNLDKFNNKFTPLKPDLRITSLLLIKRRLRYIKSLLRKYLPVF